MPFRPYGLFSAKHTWISALIHLDLRPLSRAISFTAQEPRSATYQAHLSSLQFIMDAIGQIGFLVICPPPLAAKVRAMV